MLKYSASLLLILLLSSFRPVTSREKGLDKKIRKRGLQGGAAKAGSSGDDYTDDATGRPLQSITLEITNLSYKQPLSAMFVVVHNGDATPIYTLGEPPSVALSILAENGDPTPLAKAYAGQKGVFFSGIYNEGAPWMGGGKIYITLPYRAAYPYLTIASKALNTNDGFVALNGVRIFPGLVVNGPMYDSGSEINNENCTSIPGPACDSVTGNVRSERGEGFVYVHRGFFGIGGELAQYIYDWKNPVVRVEMMSPYERN